MMLFVSEEFCKFANAYYYEHQTSSSWYPLSNGKVENAVKTAKRLMTKACEAEMNPFLALLEWRNCPSEQLSQAPVELLMGRKTRTTLQIAAPLLDTHSASSARIALQQVKNKQTHYYNCTARQQPILQRGQRV